MGAVDAAQDLQDLLASVHQSLDAFLWQARTLGESPGEQIRFLQEVFATVGRAQDLAAVDLEFSLQNAVLTEWLRNMAFAHALQLCLRRHSLVTQSHAFRALKMHASAPPSGVNDQCAVLSEQSSLAGAGPGAYAGLDASQAEPDAESPTRSEACESGAEALQGAQLREALMERLELMVVRVESALAQAEDRAKGAHGQPACAVAACEDAAAADLGEGEEWWGEDVLDAIRQFACASCRQKHRPCRRDKSK